MSVATQCRAAATQCFRSIEREFSTSNSTTTQRCGAGLGMATGVSGGAAAFSPGAATGVGCGIALLREPVVENGSR
jgi:hypothetical protein